MAAAENLPQPSAADIQAFISGPGKEPFATNAAFAAFFSSSLAAAQLHLLERAQPPPPPPPVESDSDENHDEDDAGQAAQAGGDSDSDHNHENYAGGIDAVDDADFIDEATLAALMLHI